MCSSDTRRQSEGEATHRLGGDHELETTNRQALLREAYDSGYSAGFESGTRTEASKLQTSLEDSEGAYAQGFAAGQRRLMNSEIAFAFARGQQAEQQRLRACLEKEAQGSQAREILEELTGATTTSPGSLRPARPASTSTTDAPRQYSRRGSDSSPASLPNKVPEATASNALESSLVRSHPMMPHIRGPAPISERATMPIRRRGRPRLIPDEGENRNAVATCVFCGIRLSQNSILRHKRRHHPAELAAVGVPLHSCPCWWPGCGQLQDNLVHNQLTTHLQRKHNFSPPGDSNALTENIKYIKRMPMDLQISIIAEAAQQLNAVQLRIQDLEAQLRLLKPSYVSRHGLPDVRRLHESRPRVLSAILRSRGRLPFIIQELRQLTRARGMRSQMRSDEGTWWEVADDLEAGLDPSSKLARAVIALPPPGSGPTVPLNSNTLSEAPKMNDPSWRPQYAVPLQTGWDITGPDNNPVWTRTGTTEARNNRPGAAETAVKKEPEDDDDEEDGSYQNLLAEISRRVLNNDPQSDWDGNSSDEGGNESADTGNVTARDGPDRSDDRIGPSQQRKRSATTASSPGRVKHHRAA